MNVWHDLPEDRVTAERFTAVVEIPQGGKVKYELDKQTGCLRVDRILYTSRSTQITGSSPDPGQRRH